MNLEPISNKTVVNEVVKRLSDSILKGELKPGDQLPNELELMALLSVGRNSLREAIKMLSAMGVLEVKRGHGTFVATKVSPNVLDPLIFSLILEPKSGRDLYELRTMFESMVLYVVIERATTEDLDRIFQLLNQTDEALRTGEQTIDYFVDADVCFHKELLRATHNPLIERVGASILDLFPMYIKKSIAQKGGIKRSIRNHYEILNVIKAKDEQRVLDIVKETLAEWKNDWNEEIEP